MGVRPVARLGALHAVVGLGRLIAGDGRAEPGSFGVGDDSRPGHAGDLDAVAAAALSDVFWREDHVLAEAAVREAAFRYPLLKPPDRHPEDMGGMVVVEA